MKRMKFTTGEVGGGKKKEILLFHWQKERKKKKKKIFPERLEPKKVGKSVWFERR